MAISPEQFMQSVIKMAETAVGDNEDDTVKGEQTESVPELLQPQDGPGTGPRGEHESMTNAAEKAHADNREGQGGYLDKAFDGFSSAARQTGAELSNLLDNYGPKAIVSRATPEAGVSKIGSVRLEAFSDELAKISSWKGDLLKKRLGLGKDALKKNWRKMKDKAIREGIPFDQVGK